jgi:hypothetical protein
VVSLLSAGARGGAAAAVALAVLAVPTTAHATLVMAGGSLTLSGTGASVSVSQTPGHFGASLGATVLTIADLTGTTNGWAVTATYSPPAAGTALGGANVEVSSSGVTPNPLGGVSAANVTTVTDQPLSGPVTVLTTTTNSGAGTTTATVSVKVRVPQTAVAGTSYGATISYTVASVR